MPSNGQAAAHQGVAAGWVACQGELVPGALRQACVVVAATQAAASAGLVASPTRWLQVAGPCGLEAAVDPLVLPTVAEAPLEGAVGTRGGRNGHGTVDC